MIRRFTFLASPTVNIPGVLWKPSHNAPQGLEGQERGGPVGEVNMEDSSIEDSGKVFLAISEEVSQVSGIWYPQCQEQDKS